MSLIEFTPVEYVSLVGDEVTTQALAWPERARTLRIVDAGSYCFGGDMLLGIKDLLKQIDAKHDPNIKRWHDGHKAAIADKRADADPLIEAETIVKKALRAYDDEQERVRREAERLAQEQARKDAEARALAEAAAMEREAAATGDEALRAEAHEIIAAPIVVPVVSVAKATPKVSGIAYTETWSAEVTDLGALIRYVAAHPEFAPLLTPNMTALNQQARSLKSLLRIPGVRAVATKDVRAGRR